MERLLIVLNLSAGGRMLTVPSAAGGTIMVSTYMDRHESLQTNSITLRRHEGLLISKKIY